MQGYSWKTTPFVFSKKFVFIDKAIRVMEIHNKLEREETDDSVMAKYRKIAKYTNESEQQL